MGGFMRIKRSPFIALDGGVDEYHDTITMPNNKLQGKGKTSNIFIDGGVLKKRPGKTLWGANQFLNSFNGAHEYVDANGVAHLLVGCNGSIYEVTSTAETEIDSGLSNEELHFVTHRGRCWINGENTQRKVTESTAARVGVVAPDTAPAAVKAGTGLTGSYAWKFTYCIKENSVVVWESDPSPVSDSLSCSNEGATITPGASADSRVNARQIYRTTASGAVYQYEGEIDNNTEGATFTSGSVTDANLGDIVEENHGVPAQGKVSEGCNERMFWIVNSGNKSRLYYSEQAHTEAYQEYQTSTNYIELISGGLGVGIKRLYNPNTAREDLYVFQETGTSILQDGNPYNPLVSISRSVGLKNQDSIVEYGRALVFLSQQNTVYMIRENRLIDISTRSWPKTLETLLTKEKCRATLLYNHYYAITTKTSNGKGYNHTTWVCDLRKVREVESGVADAVWFPWEIDAEYLLSREDGTVLMFSNKDRRIYTLAFSKKKDEDENQVESEIVATFRTKDFGGDTLTVRKCPRQLFVRGKQQRTLDVKPYYGDYYSGRGDDQEMARPEGGSYFIVGQSKMGDILSTFPEMIPTQIPSSVVGVYFSFGFTKDESDNYFEINGIQFTYNGFETGEL